MPQERLPKQALHAKANGRRPVGRPRTRWTDYIEDLGWNRLGLRPSEMMKVMEDREVWRFNLELCPRNLHGKAGNKERKEEDEVTEEMCKVAQKFHVASPTAWAFKDLSFPLLKASFS